MDWFYDVFQGVLVFYLLVAHSALVEDEGEDHEGLHQESPTDSEQFSGLDVHDP